MPGETVFGGKGILTPFRPFSQTSDATSQKNLASSNQEVPAHDSPEFDALHRKGVSEYLRSLETPRASTSDDPSETL